MKGNYPFNPLPPLFGPFACLCYIGLMLWTIKDLWLVIITLLAIVYVLLKLGNRRHS